MAHIKTLGTVAKLRNARKYMKVYQEHSVSPTCLNTALLDTYFTDSRFISISHYIILTTNVLSAGPSGRAI
jgi:hypothetical protein